MIYIYKISMDTLTYGEVIDKLNQFAYQSGINKDDHEVKFAAYSTMKLLCKAITENTTRLMDLPEGQPIAIETVINTSIAKSALMYFQDFIALENAGINFLQVLEEGERKTYNELLEAFSEYDGDLEKIHSFIMDREHIRDMPQSSHLYALIHCILRGEKNLTEVIHQELRDHQIELRPTPVHDGRDSLRSKFKEILQQCALV